MNGPLAAAYSGGMITRLLLILAGLLAVGTVGTFLFYVSVLTLVTTVFIVVGLLATLVLGYLAGSSSPDEPPPTATRLRNVAAIDAPRDVLFFPEVVAANAEVKNRIHGVTTAERTKSRSSLLSRRSGSTEPWVVGEK
jgi:hypothetical protein